MKKVKHPNLNGYYLYMKKNKIIISIFCLVFFMIVSCNKNNPDKEMPNDPEVAEASQSALINEEIEIPAPVEVKETKPKLNPTEEDVYPDLDRTFLYKDWHPLKQTEYLKEVKKRLINQKEDDIDDSLYDDEFTVEFSLHDETRNFCIYHNIRNIEEYDTDDFEIYNYVNTRNWGELVWCFQEIDSISIEWVYSSGSIVKVGTEDPRYSTKRGIKVGDSAEKIMEAYESDCTIKIKNYETNKFEVVSEKEPPCMVLSKSNECISLNMGNALAEGMMTISYMLEDGVVTKIIIQGS